MNVCRFRELHIRPEIDPLGNFQRVTFDRRLNRRYFFARFMDISGSHLYGSTGKFIFRPTITFSFAL